MKHLLGCLIVLISCSTLWAQNGFLSGTITDAAFNNESLPYANVVVVGKSIGISTDDNGNFELQLPAGKHQIEFSYVGYQSHITDITIEAGKKAKYNYALQPEENVLQDVVIISNSNRQKESALLMEQQKALVMKQQIGAQELARKGVSDVAAAVVKTSGVTKQQGSSAIFVRGLGDRYNATTLNGLPVASNNVENKNIALDLFPTDIVEYVGIDKVYHTDLYGDFAGGNVDIVSKNYTGKPFLNISLGTKSNTNAVQNDAFMLQSTPNQWGFGGAEMPNNPLGAYNFNSLNYEKQSPWAGGLNLTTGGSFNVGEEGKLNLFATVGFDNSYASITDGFAFADINGAGLATKRFHTYTNDSYSTATTGMFNANYRINENHSIKLVSLYLNASKNQTETYRGYAVDFAELSEGLILRNTFNQTQLFTQQILGKHQLIERLEANWGVAYNAVNDNMPDRSQFKLNLSPNGYMLNSQSAPNNHRYFQELTEDEIAGNVKLSYAFAQKATGDYKAKVHLGYQGRVKSRDFEATQFNFKSNYTPINYSTVIVDPYALDGFYNQQNFQDNYFSVSTFRGNIQVPNALRPQTYTGDLTIHAATVAVDYAFNDKLTMVAGLRAETIEQQIDWDTQLGGRGSDALTKDALLPSLNLKYELNEKNNFRFGASKTYTLPQFKERAIFVYEEVTQVKIGNRDLYESDDYNLDLKWEFFPENDELISVGTFGKYIVNPINEVIVASSTNDISYINTGDYGYVIGAEIEVRKNIWANAEETSKITAGLNASYLYSDQELNSEKVRRETNYQVDFTDSKSAFTGASDLLLNADLSFRKEFKNDRNLLATVTYTQYTDRIYSLGTNQRGNLVDKGVGQLDFILKSQLSENLGLGLTLRNITDPAIDRVQENAGSDVLSVSFKRGMDFGLSLNYSF